MKLAYFGTPEDAVPPLLALLDAGHDVVLAVSQPDRRRGRGGHLGSSPLKAAADARGIPVLTPARSREVVDDVAASGAELGVVVAFGQILPAALLVVPPRGFVNVHFSLLPRWRGAAPVERAILAGDAETGVAVMDVTPELDTGGVYAQERTTIGREETAGELHARLDALGADLLVRTLSRLDALTPVPQVGDATYAAKLTPEEFELEASLPPEALVRRVRAGNPRPGAWRALDDAHGGVRLKVWRAHTDDGRFVPDEVQPEGKRAMPYTAWRAGWRGTDPFA